MVDPIFFTAAATAVSLLAKGLSTFKARYQDVKATKEETQLLDEFLCDLQDCAAQYQIDNGVTLKPTTATSTNTSFLKTLEDAQKKLDEWSSQDSGFFSQRSPGERLRKLRALRDRVHRALDIEMYRMTAFIFGHLAQNNQTHTEPRSEAELGQVGPMAWTTDDLYITPCGASTSNITDPTPGSSLSENVQTDRRDSSPLVEKKHIIELWVPCDSWKQWNDVKKKLKGIKDIKKGFINPETKQMRVELEEWSKIDPDTLIKEIQLALPKDKKLAPRLVKSVM